MRSTADHRIIETRRLYLRELTPEDADRLFALDNNAEVMKYLVKYQDPTDTLEDAAALVRKCMAYYEQYPGLGVWATVRKRDHRFIGWTFLKYCASQISSDIEIGYRYFPPFWNQGYCTEMCAAVVNYAFETLQAKRIVALVNPENGASIRVLEKLGLRYEKMVEEHGQPAALYVRPG